MGSQWTRSTGVCLALGQTKCVSKTKHHYHVLIRKQTHEQKKTFCTVFHTNGCKTLTYQCSIIQSVLENITMERCACWCQYYVLALTWTQSNVRRDWVAWLACSSPPNACYVSCSFPAPQPFSPEAGPVQTAPSNACSLQPPHWQTETQHWSFSHWTIIFCNMILKNKVPKGGFSSDSIEEPFRFQKEPFSEQFLKELSVKTKIPLLGIFCTLEWFYGC